MYRSQRLAAGTCAVIVAVLVMTFALCTSQQTLVLIFCQVGVSGPASNDGVQQKSTSRDPVALPAPAQTTAPTAAIAIPAPTTAPNKCEIDYKFGGTVHDQKRNIFIDLGANDGQSLEKYVELYTASGKQLSSLRVHLWEMNAMFKNVLVAKASNVAGIDGDLHVAAVGTKDGTLEYFQDAEPVKKSNKFVYNMTGSSLFNRNDNPGKKVKGKATLSRVCDFSAWIKHAIPEHSNVFLKMDIEGAEFEVLEALIVTGAVKKFQTLAIEWHGYKIRQDVCGGKRRSRCPRELELESALANAGVIVLDWGKYSGM